MLTYVQYAMYKRMAQKYTITIRITMIIYLPYKTISSTENPETQWTNINKTLPGQKKKTMNNWDVSRLL